MTAATAVGDPVGSDREPRCVSVPTQAATDLCRIYGQLGDAIAMIEAGRSHADTVTELAAASKALSRSGFTIIPAGLRQCIDPSEELDDQPHELTVEQLEKLVLSLA